MSDEKKAIGIIRKCKCDSVWCPQCFLYRHAPKQAERLKGFKWENVRAVMLSVDPKQFENPYDAYFIAKKKNSISQFIARLKKGQKTKQGRSWSWKHKPVKILRYMSFLEWHKDGRPHWHLFIETATGQKIGNEKIRAFWDLGRWIHEDYFKNQKHWDHITGYFKKNGYFHKGKKHQSRLPAWSMNMPGLKIRRWSASVFSGEIEKEKRRLDAVEEISRWIDKQAPMIVDTRTGEILKDNQKEKDSTTYQMRLDACGLKTWINMSSPSVNIRGIMDIPYRDIRRELPGRYVEGKGFTLELSEREFLYFFSKIEKTEYIETSNDISKIRKNMDDWHEYRAGQGWSHYSSIYQVGG